MKGFTINIVGLALKEHAFDFVLDQGFFKEFGSELLPGGEFAAHVVLNKKETFIEADFRITGHARLICDRSLDPFDEPVDVHKKVVFKYGEEAAELSDEIVVIPHDTAVLDLGQYFYEFIALDVPMKRLHPRFRNEKGDDGADKLVYSSGQEDGPGEDEIDPRWEKLKRLK